MDDRQRKDDVEPFVFTQYDGSKTEIHRNSIFNGVLKITESFVIQYKPITEYFKL